MKARDIIAQYEAGERNFQGVNLRGVIFRGVNLAGADFTGADIRGTKFIDKVEKGNKGKTKITPTNLTGAKFCQAQAGLQRRWAMCLVFVAFIATGMIGISLGWMGFILEILNQFNLFLYLLLTLFCLGELLFLLPTFSFKITLALSLPLIFTLVISFLIFNPISSSLLLDYNCNINHCYSHCYPHGQN